jgi:hypothetical protein
MSRRQNSFTTPSLAQLFEAPDGYLGSFGWVCGYSADAAFLDDAAERFTRQTRAQRANGGRLALALMLDPSQPQIAPVDAPGVIHLPCVDPEHRPFRLLHAKLAFLCFRGAEGWLLRLIVSTGNWTRQTLEESLDIAWHVELREADVTATNPEIRQIRSDLAAAWDLLDWMRGHFDTRIFGPDPAAGHASESGDACRAFDELAGSLSGVRGFSPRIFDNRSQSLLKQLPVMVKAHSTTVSRNYLALGSGFFEAGETRDRVPSVLDGIVARLQKNGLLTQGPEVDVFVNRRACQAVARTLPAIKKRGWKVRPAGQPDFLGSRERSLHAKFIFSANSRTNSSLCNSAWVYLGSGNLTSPGFDSAMSRDLGNLEAGVVLTADELCWYEGRGVPPERLVTNLLPMQWHAEFEDENDVAPGDDPADPTIEFAAPPIACLYSVTAEESVQLEARAATVSDMDVLDSAGGPCPRLREGIFLWPEPRCPRQVEVRWGTANSSQRKASVPVVDQFGRVAAAALRPIGIDEAWSELENFPMPPDDDPPPEGEDQPGDHPAYPPPPSAAGSRPPAYPVREMMMLLERIAAKQIAVVEADWSAWCTRLEQSLSQAAESPVVGLVRDIGEGPVEF